jgi:hypothetical protein
MLFWHRGNFVLLFASTTAHAEAEYSSLTELPNAHFWPYEKDFGQESLLTAEGILNHTHI